MRVLNGLIFGLGAGCLTLAPMSIAQDHTSLLVVIGCALIGIEIVRWGMHKKVNSDHNHPSSGAHNAVGEA